MDTHDSERRAVQAPVLLLLLAEHPAHGYELIRRLRAFGRAPADSAQVYRLLRALEAEGSVVSRWRASASGPARREYQLTEQGDAALRRASVRLTELDGTLHRFLERYDRLRTAVDDGSRDEVGAARNHR